MVKVNKIQHLLLLNIPLRGMAEALETEAAEAAPVKFLTQKDALACFSKCRGSTKPFRAAPDSSAFFAIRHKAVIALNENNIDD